MVLKQTSCWVLAWSLLVAVGPVTAQDARLVVGQGQRLLQEATSAAERGVVLPPGLLPAAMLAVEVNDAFTPEEIEQIVDTVDGYLAELTALRATPGVAGSSRFVNTGALVAGARTDITQVYVVPRTLGPGAAIKIGGYWRTDVMPQNQFADEPGYVSARASGVEFSPLGVVSGAVAGGLQGPLVTPVFEITSGELRQGSQVTIRYQSLDLPPRAQAGFSLPLQVRLAPDSTWLNVPGNPLVLVPGRVARLVARAPASVMPGAPIVIGLRLEDEFGNLAMGSLPSFDVLLDGAFVTRVPAGTDPTPIFDLIIDRAGPALVEVRSSGGGLVTRLQLDVGNTQSTVQWPVIYIHAAARTGITSAVQAAASFANAADAVIVVEDDAWLDGAAWPSRPMQVMDGFARSANVRSGGQQVVLSRDRLRMSEMPRKSLVGPRDLRNFLDGNGRLAIALPEVPAPAAMLNASATRLAGIKAGDGTFEWYGNRLAAAGLRIGFVGSPASQTGQVGRPATSGRTAVPLLPGETLFDALDARRTWVTSGPAIALDVRLNDALPGSRIPAAELRQVTGRVRGTAPVQMIELVRNGTVIATRHFARNPASRTVKMTFFSSSEPLSDQFDVPRNGREWIGYLQVTGAELSSLDASNFRNRIRQAAAVNPALVNRLDFITWTRGHPSSLYFDLAAGETEDSTVVLLELSLAEGFEDATQLGIGRPPARIPPARMLFDLQELIAGEVVREYDVSGYQDRVTLELVDRELPTDVSFEFIDRREFGEGDYYYVRVTQDDDHMAWSSPVYVGGFDLQ